jgi:hypothetical protein
MLCPSCAAQLPSVTWKVVAAFIAAPLVVAAVVAVLVRGYFLSERT